MKNLMERRARAPRRKNATPSNMDVDAHLRRCYNHHVASDVVTTMPRLSKRMRLLREYERVLQARLKDRILREAVGVEDETQDFIDAIVDERYKELSSKRYLFRGGRYRKANHVAFLSMMSYYKPDDLNASESSSGILSDATDSTVPWLSKEEFLNEFRMSPKQFWTIVDSIKNDRIFKWKTGRKQAPVELQLGVLLSFLGTQGEGGSNPKLRSFYRMGRGTVSLYKRRAATAIRRQLRSAAIKWPDEEERHRLASLFLQEYNFPNCIGLVDGTLFQLFFRPTTDDFADYSGRKYPFSICCMIVCDAERRIIAYLAGWPGSCHDDRVFKKMKLYSDPEGHFDLNQYLLGDSAFENRWFIVAAYKKPAGTSIPREHEEFNTAMSSPRVLSEHCIGILKGRFPWLREIRTVIKGKKDLKRILAYIDVCVILHNLLVKSKVPDEWDTTDDFSDIDDAARAPLDNDDELNLAVPAGASGDRRRHQLMCYINETNGN
jgi:hypothetical protein